MGGTKALLAEQPARELAQCPRACGPVAASVGQASESSSLGQKAPSCWKSYRVQVATGGRTQVGSMASRRVSVPSRRASRKVGPSGNLHSPTRFGLQRTHSRVRAASHQLVACSPAGGDWSGPRWPTPLSGSLRGLQLQNKLQGLAALQHSESVFLQSNSRLDFPRVMRVSHLHTATTQPGKEVEGVCEDTPPLGPAASPQ